MTVKPEIIPLRKQEPGYPQRLQQLLGKAAPAELFAMGNLSLLESRGLGFCGSRDVSEKGLHIARDCAQQSVDGGFVVVSGNARGVDRMVHKTALQHGGSTLFVLPEGLNHFRIHSDLKPNWDWDRVLVLSQFAPDQKWQTWNAMKRNKTILALVFAMIVIEAGEKGGTLAAGQDALKMSVPLFVVNRTDMDSSLGGKKLLQMGGHMLNKSQSKGRANMQPVFSAPCPPAQSRANFFDMM